MSTTSAKQRRSLKEALRTILWKCRRQAPDETVETVGSGILRREPSLPIINNDSTTAFLLGLDPIPNDDDHDSNNIPDRFDISSLATSAAMSSTRTLLPKMSLSQFEVYHPPIQETRYLQRGRCKSVSSSLAEGASCQASLVTLSPSCSISTLRIQSSSQTLRSDSEYSCSQLSLTEKFDRDFDQLLRPRTSFHCPSPPRSSHTLSPRRGTLRKRTSVASLSSPSPSRQALQSAFDADPIAHIYPVPYDYSQRFSRPLSVIEEVASYVDETSTPRHSPIPHVTDTPRVPTPQLFKASTPVSVSAKSDLANPLLSIKNFSSFCALDTVTPGCPVTATSKDLRYIFEIGENFCLNNHGCDNISIDIITGSDAAGNSVTHLVLFSPLIIPHSGRSRFMLASLVDVTDFIQDTASLPELELNSEESGESDPPTPRFFKPYPSPKTPKYQLTAENLLGGCFVDDPRTPVQRYEEDIWINLATEERKQYSQQSKASSGMRTPVSTISLSSIDDLLDDFMCRLQELHSDFFLLAKSPLDDNYYEICNVSPRVYESRDYVNGHLSKTSVADMAKLSAHLTSDEAFDMPVRWGVHGVPKHLYCVPLFARTAVTWICFLVEPGLPLLW